MGPWYGGDGRGETYLDPVHTDGVGAPVLDLDDFFVALNKTDPGPCVPPPPFPPALPH